MGCAECKLLRLLRREESVEELVGVDLRESVLEAQCGHLQPLAADFILLRKQPLSLCLMQGVCVCVCVYLHSNVTKTKGLTLRCVSILFEIVSFSFYAQVHV